MRSFTKGHTAVVLNDHSRFNRKFVFYYYCFSLNEFGMNSPGAALCDQDKARYNLFGKDYHIAKTE